MIIAGNCLMVDEDDVKIAEQTAFELNHRGLADYFRCKVWGGGTTPEKYFKGIGFDGIRCLRGINAKIMPTGTEVQVPFHIWQAKDLGFIWIGARNCQNYALLEQTKTFRGKVFIKRCSGMTIDELIGLYDILKEKIGRKVYVIERGINTFDRQAGSRWSPDLKGVLRLKWKRPDIFNGLVVDCSHSVGMKEYTEDVYKAFKAIGVEHFMFETSINPSASRTDREQILSIDELERILK